MKEDSVPILFSNDPRWTLIKRFTDRKIRDSIANIDFETKIKTETIIARHVNTSK